MSVVPPPMSTTMLPDASVIGMPAPIAAAIASSIRCTSLALARIALSFTARRSTCVISDGTPMTTRGRSQPLRLCALRMKCVSIFSAASKSAMTPSCIGLIAVMLPGVRPEHLLRLGADRLDPAGDLVDRDDRRLADDDALAAREDAGVGGAEVDGEVVGEAGQERRKHELTP